MAPDNTTCYKPSAPSWPLTAVARWRFEDARHIGGEAFEEVGLGVLAGAVGAELLVLAAFEGEDGDCFFFGIDDPEIRRVPLPSCECEPAQL
jgi:hypothetical protein